MNQLLPVSQRTEVDVNGTLTLAKLMADSGFFGDARDAAQAMVKILAGKELGLGPVASMTGINVIKNKVALSANLIASTIQRSGRYGYRVIRLDSEKCIIEVLSDNKVIGTSTFSMEDARRAGLTGDNWRKYPRNMLFARAISNAAKWYCPSIFGGPVYTPDELGAAVDAEEGNIIDVTPEPPTVVKVVRVTIGPEQLEELERLILRKDADSAKLLSYYGINSLTDMTPEQHAEAIGLLRGRPDVSQVPQGVGG